MSADFPVHPHGPIGSPQFDLANGVIFIIGCSQFLFRRYQGQKEISFIGKVLPDASQAGNLILLSMQVAKAIVFQNGEIKPMDKDRYKKAKGYSRLSRDKKNRFRDLYMIRDAAAKKANLPPNMVFPNKDLLDAANNRLSVHDLKHKVTAKRLSTSDKRKLIEDFTAVLVRS